jgi:hypothetical protein
MTLVISGSDLSKHMKMCVVDFPPNLLFLGYLNTLVFCRNKGGFFIISMAADNCVAQLGYKPQFFFENFCKYRDNVAICPHFFETE